MKRTAIAFVVSWLFSALPAIGHSGCDSKTSPSPAPSSPEPAAQTTSRTTSQTTSIESARGHESKTAEPASTSERTAGHPSPRDGERIVEATVVEESPTGDGRCTQKSYRIKPTAGGAAPYWVHFENCYDSPNAVPAETEPLGLEVGQRYRFTLRDERSANFPPPRLVGAEAL